MYITRVYTSESLAVGSSVNLDAASNHYLRHVLRLKQGDSIALFNGEDDYDYYAQLEIDGKKTSAIILSDHHRITESPLKSGIIQGLGRTDHIDLTIQKCTELGISRISLFNAAYSQIPLKASQRLKRMSHWQAIAIKACEQCGRHKPPMITFHSSLDEAINTIQLNQCRLLLDFEAPALSEFITSNKIMSQVCVLIGPEGGLSDAEINLARSREFIGVSLGPRVLRTETAAITATASIQSGWGDMSA